MRVQAEAHVSVVTHTHMCEKLHMCVQGIHMHIPMDTQKHCVHDKLWMISMQLTMYVASWLAEFIGIAIFVTLVSVSDFNAAQEQTHYSYRYLALP